MQYRSIGKWGIKVSEIGLGSWLTYGATVDEKNSINLVHFAYDKGINFFDTANVYAHGQSEEIVGKAIKSLRRDSIVLASKVFFPMGDGPNDHGLSRKHVFEQCHYSLKRLGTDYLDIYQCHRHDPNVPMYEIVRAMDDLSSQGKILYWGVSEWSSEQIKEATLVAEEMHAMPPISNQPQYNMLSRKIEDKVIPTCAQLGVGQLVFCPLAQGILTGKYSANQPYPEDSRAANSEINGFMMGLLTRDTFKLIDTIKSIAQNEGVSMSQLALKWCLRLTNISSVITGSTKIAQIEDNIKASGKKLPEHVIKQIDDILKAAVLA